MVAPRSTTDLPRAVPMHNLDSVAGFPQASAHVLRNHHGAMLAARAAEGDRQVALAFPHIVRQEINQQLGDALDELFGLRKRTYVLRHLGVASGERAELGDEV